MRLINSALPIISSQLKIFPLAIVTLFTLGGCSWFDNGLFENSWFSKDDDEIVPAKLIKIEAEVKLVNLWDRNLGKGAEDSAIKLVPALSGSRVFGASGRRQCIWHQYRQWKHCLGSECCRLLH
jgi:hypothetical protein